MLGKLWAGFGQQAQEQGDAVRVGQVLEVGSDLEGTQDLA